MFSRMQKEFAGIAKVESSHTLSSLHNRESTQTDPRLPGDEKFFLFRNSRELKILSHPNIIHLNYHDRAQFLVIFFDELRVFLITLHHYPQYNLIFSSNSIILQTIKNFWVSLSHCSLASESSESKENNKIYLQAEKNILLLYQALNECRKKISITIVEKLFYSLHLVVQNCYPKNEIKKIQFSLSDKNIEEITRKFYPLKIMLQDPAHSIFIYENEACKQEFSSLFFLYQKSDFSTKSTDSLRKDIFLTTEKYPQAKHDEILNAFLKGS